MRISRLLTIMFLTGAGVISTSPPAGSADFQCVQLLDRDNSIVCAPPRGQLIHNVNNKYVCSPGRCVNLSDGRTVCSAVPGGAVALDSSNRPLCYGGCVEPTEEMCVAPIADKS